MNSRVLQMTWSSVMKAFSEMTCTVVGLGSPPGLNQCSLASLASTSLFFHSWIFSQSVQDKLCALQVNA